MKAEADTGSLWAKGLEEAMVHRFFKSFRNRLKGAITKRERFSRVILVVTETGFLTS